MSTPTSNIFKITSAEIQKRLFPTSYRQGSNEFFIGNDPQENELTEQECVNIINEQESWFLSTINKTPYKKMFTKIDGEVLDWKSDGVKTVYNLSLFPCSNVLVFINYFGGWEIKSNADAIATNLYTVNGSTGQITFTTAPEVDSRIVVTYNHSSGNKILCAKEIIIKKTCVEISRRYNFFNSDTEVQRFIDWEASANAQALSIAKLMMGINEFDNIEMVYNDTGKDDLNFFLRLKREYLTTKYYG
jgi:hypothetical protein